MQFSTLSILAFFALPGVIKAAQDLVITSPVCISFQPIRMEGNATFVGDLPQIGDMSIGKYEGVSKVNNKVDKGLPTQSGGYKDIAVSYESECVVTQQSSRAAPTCSYRFEMEFCRTISDFKDNCRKGTFSAYGRGPGKIQITGGTDDFLSASGQITTTTSFDTGTVNQDNGNLEGSNVEMRIQLCYYEDSNTRGIFDLLPRVKATDFDVQRGTEIVEDVRVGYFTSGDFVQYNNINFGPSGSTKGILINYSRRSTGDVRVSIKIGDTEIGESIFGNTGSNDIPKTMMIPLDVDVEGMQDVTFEVTSGSWDLWWFELSDQAV